MSAASEALLGVLTALGWVVVLPLGLRLIGPVVPRHRSRAWPAAGVLGAVSVLAPTGWAGVALALPAALATAILAVAGARHLARTLADRLSRARPGTPAGPDVALAAALVLPAIGAAALVAERGGWTLLGFAGGNLALTVPHMLFAGFGACLVAGLLGRTAHAGGGAARTARVAAWAVPVGVLLVLAGYFVSDTAELVGTVVLTVALWAALWSGAASGRARGLRLTAAVTGTVTMLLAVWWAGGEASGVVHPSLGWMLATHGVLNALGVVLCSLLALHLAAGGAPGARPDAVGQGAFTYAEVGATERDDLPPGYRHLRVRHHLGPGGAADLVRVGDALLTWQVHARARVRLATSAAGAAPGARVTTLLGAGPLRLVEPCEVVWTERSARRVAFGYGTLPGHVFTGEEAFVIERDDDGLWFAAVVFSRPVVWWVRALAALVPTFQRAYLAWLAHGARSVLRSPDRQDGSHG